MATAFLHSLRLDEPSQCGLALSHLEFWWAWPHSLVEKSVYAARLECWHHLAEKAARANAQVQAAIRRNHGDSQRLPHWVGLRTALAPLRHPKSVDQIASGSRALTDGLLLFVAAKFGLPLCKFWPETPQEWMARSTVWLSEFFHDRHLCNQRASLPDARIYAEYRFGRIPAVATSPNMFDPESLLHGITDSDQKAINRVAERLALGLHRIWGELEQRRVEAEQSALKKKKKSP